ncbi:mandelate racemase/muconate lactonizing enzyme family protein [Sinomonas sp. JGH33]|uniref:Mandelate racemase/muconate lactonizing enzyme family protein n=1 Tax=Sinomonas terricola TaxID=3110330 RepID=A0ABU5TC52_9MICC|nr:mandelate racemase/muconate lactonizing enzyme family protein [Sinomonas sp. JGH33]MEA5457277.1 mandelate racemase/muconate lactonizing enzyme family protein [Sinomonas sp. JGH33]
MAAADNLRILDVKRTMIHLPFRERVKPWNDLLVSGWGLIEVLEVHTNAEGVLGVGETLVDYTWQRVTDEKIASVIGTNPAEHLFDDSLGAGLQIALLDAVGQALEVPAHRLLGLPAVRDWCPISWWNTKMPPELLAREARQALDEGYLAHKFKARPWFDVREQVKAIAAATPEDYLIDIDWNGMLRSPGEALPVLSELDELPKIGLYESPIRQDDMIGQQQLRGRIRRPLAEHYRKDLFPVWMRDDALDAFVAVCTPGMSGILSQGITAAAFNKTFWLQVVGSGITTAFTTHLGAVLTHASWPMVTGMNTFADDLIEKPLAIAGGHVKVPTEPGLGITLDRNALERYRVPPAYRVQTPRHLLTFNTGTAGTRMYGDMLQMWEDCRVNHNVAVQPVGASLEVRTDDGSPEFDRIWRRARQKPIWSFS